MNCFHFCISQCLVSRRHMALEMLPFRTQPQSLSLNFISMGSEEITTYDCSDGTSARSGWCPVVSQEQLPLYTSLSCQCLTDWHHSQKCQQMSTLSARKKILAWAFTFAIPVWARKKNSFYRQQFSPYHPIHTLYNIYGWKFRPGPPLPCHCTCHVHLGNQLPASRKQDKAMLAFLKSLSLVWTQNKKNHHVTVGHQHSYLAQENMHISVLL